MKKSIAGFVAGLVLSFGPYQTSAFAADSYTLSNGTYNARFAQGCAIMTIRNGGKSISYAFGPCGGSPTFNSSGTFNGKVIKIKAATYTLSSASSSSMTGKWKLRDYSATVTFKK